jgi:ribonuclease-3
VLASALEAVVGAVSLDQGYPAAEALALRLLEPEMVGIERPPAARNPKSALQEALQATGGEPPTYDIVGVTGEDHARQFTAEVRVDGRVLGSGTGPRKSTAERRAAEAALAAMSESR